MTTMPEHGEPFADGPLIVRRGSTVWLNVEMEDEEYATELFRALRYMIDEKVTLDEVSQQDTTVALTMTIKPEWVTPKEEG